MVLVWLLLPNVRQKLIAEFLANVGLWLPCVSQTQQIGPRWPPRCPMTPRPIACTPAASCLPTPRSTSRRFIPA